MARPPVSCPRQTTRSSNLTNQDRRGPCASLNDRGGFVIFVVISIIDGCWCNYMDNLGRIEPSTMIRLSTRESSQGPATRALVSVRSPNKGPPPVTKKGLFLRLTLCDDHTGVLD